MSQHPSYGGRLSRSATPAPERPEPAEQAAVFPATRRYGDRACCCIAQPAVIAVMPPGSERKAETDLLLCGHHYRACEAALAAAGATILDMAGQPLAADEWPGGSG